MLQAWQPSSASELAALSGAPLALPSAGEVAPSIVGSFDGTRLGLVDRRPRAATKCARISFWVGALASRVPMVFWSWDRSGLSYETWREWLLGLFVCAGRHGVPLLAFQALSLPQDRHHCCHYRLHHRKSPSVRPIHSPRRQRSLGRSRLRQRVVQGLNQAPRWRALTSFGCQQSSDAFESWRAILLYLHRWPEYRRLCWGHRSSELRCRYRCRCR